jgi:hypothetical protein
MASTVAGTDPPVGSIKKYSFLVTAHTDGTVANTLQNAAGVDIKFNGVLLRVTIVPGAGGVQPDDNYDLTLKDDNEVDVLAAQGTDLDEATTYSFCPAQRLDDNSFEAVSQFPVVGELDLATGATSMGNGNQCTLVLYVG